MIKRLYSRKTLKQMKSVASVALFIVSAGRMGPLKRKLFRKVSAGRMGPLKRKLFRKIADLHFLKS